MPDKRPEPRFYTDVWEAYVYTPDRRSMVLAEGTYRTCMHAAYDACKRVHDGALDRNALAAYIRGEENEFALVELYKRITMPPHGYFTQAYGATFGVRRKMIDA